MLEIINDIRKIVSGGATKYDISEFLFEQGCLYVAEKIACPKDNNRVVKTRMVNYHSAKIRYDYCKHVFETLNLLGIEYAVVKGAVLAQTVYGDLSYRSSSDVDLLVSKKHIDEVKRILLSCGFRQGRIVAGDLVPFTREELVFQSGTSHQIAPFLKKTNDKICPIVNVDINFDVMWGESPQKTNMDFFLTYTKQHSLFGVEIKKLQLEAEFIAMCLHHYKDMNSIYMLLCGKFKLTLFFDIFYFIHNNELNLDVLKNISQTMKVTPYIYYCLYYTDLLFCSEKIQRIMIVIGDSGFSKIQNTYGLVDDEQKKWSVSFYDRLLCEDISQYIVPYLKEADILKVKYNVRNM